MWVHTINAFRLPAKTSSTFLALIFKIQKLLYRILVKDLREILGVISYAILRSLDQFHKLHKVLLLNEKRKGSSKGSSKRVKRSYLSWVRKKVPSRCCKRYAMAPSYALSWDKNFSCASPRWNLLTLPSEIEPFHGLRRNIIFLFPFDNNAFCSKLD